MFLKNLLVGDTDAQRDKANAKNWEGVSQAYNDRQKAVAYQDAMRNYAKENPDKWSLISDSYGNTLDDSFLDSFNDDLKNKQDYFNEQYTKNRWKEFGDGGLVSGAMNPLMQTVSLGTNAISTLNGGEGDRWDGNGWRRNRDMVSDLGAVGETALDLATLGTGMGAKTALGTIGKGAALGAGYGLTGGLNEMGKNTDLGTLALQTGLGGAIGGGIAGLGYGAGKLWNKYGKTSPSKELAVQTVGTNEEAGKYQNALNTLKEAGIDTSSVDALKKSYRNVIKPLHTDKAVEGTANENLFKTITDAYKTFYGKNGEEFAGAMAKATSPVAGVGATASQVANAGPVRQSLGQQFRNFAGNIPNMGNDLANSKLGNRVSSLLKTKAGKVGAGVGGGLLLAKLLAGQNGQPAQDSLSDEELMQLYNYYGGGQ